MLETVLVVFIVAASAIYMIYKQVKKFRHLNGANIRPCGHCCDNCPFAKDSPDGVSACRSVRLAPAPENKPAENELAIDLRDMISRGHDAVSKNPHKKAPRIP